jgi:hypothetical protein
VALWSGHEVLRHRLRFASQVVLWAVVIAPFVIWIFRDLQTAANFAQVVSVIGLLLGTSGTLATSPKADPPEATVAAPPAPQTEAAREAEAPETKTPESPPLPPYLAEVKPAKQRSTRWQSILVRAGAVASLVAALVAATLLLVPQKGANPTDVSGTYTDVSGDVRQRLVLVSGPAPVLFDNGTTWKWLDLPNGKTVVTFSPGGGAKNDGLRDLGGVMTSTGHCSAYVSWSFRADGHFIGEDAPDSASEPIPLPDHVDQIVLTIETDHGEYTECSLGVTWIEPSIRRH